MRRVAMVALLSGALALLVAAGSTVGTSALLSDQALADATFDALPTLWWASGDDAAGAFGDGSPGAGTDVAQRVSWRTGVAIPRGVPVEHVSAGDGSACGIAGGRLYCWGDNAHGQLGDGTTDDSAFPVAVATAPNGGSALPADAVVTDVSVASGAACAVADAEVYCWGDNSSGRLGDGTEVASTVPVAVAADGADGSALPSGTATRVVTGGGPAGSTTSFTCAVAGGSAYCWGSQEQGRLGHGSAVNTPSLVAVAVDESWGAGATVTHLALGSHSACAVALGKVYCWGNSQHGVLGDAENDVFTDQTVPIGVETAPSSGLPSSALVTDVAVGASSACVVHDGDAYCWGTNRAGQLGADIAVDTDHTSTAVRRAVAVVRAGTGASELPADASVTALATGGRLDGADAWCLLAARPSETRRPYCWGAGSSGQLGLGPVTDVRVPVALLTHPASQLPGPIDVGRIALGQDFTITLAAS